MNKYLLTNFEVEPAKLAQGVADLMQAELVQIIKKDGSQQTPSDFNIKEFKANKK